MGLIDKKKSVFTTIGSYTSMKQSQKMPDSTNIFPSVNNKKDVVPYLLDVLKVTAGSFAIQQLVGQLFTGFIDSVEPELKKSVKNQTVQYNSGDGLPQGFKSGYDVKINQIDTYKKLKTNPDSSEGNLLYDKGTPNFDSTAYQAIGNNGTDTTFGNLDLNYNSATDSFKFKPNLNNTPNPNVGQWMGSFVDNTTIINKKEFMTNVMNAFYGTITKNQGKSVEEVAGELEINTILEQLANDDDSFEISPEEYDAILDKSQQLVDGVVNYDLGCGIMATSLPMSGMTDLISNISGSTDPNYISNQIGKSLDDSINDNNKETAANNNATIKDNFFQRIIKIISQQLIQAVCTVPQIRTILAISSAIQNNGLIKIKSIKDSLKDFKVYLKCLIKKAMEMISKFIYNFILTFIVALISPIIKKIIKEKVNQFVDIIKSLVAGKTLDTG